MLKSFHFSFAFVVSGCWISRQGPQVLKVISQGYPARRPCWALLYATNYCPARAASKGAFWVRNGLIDLILSLLKGYESKLKCW